MKDWIGREMVQHDVLTPGLLDRFRATIDSDDAGDCAAQGLHWCLCLPNARTNRKKRTSATDELKYQGMPK